MSLSRITLPMKVVLKVLLEQPHAERYGLEIAKACEQLEPSSALEPSTVYAILLRLRGADWVTSRWEPAEQAHAEGRPPRRYYQLTMLGETRAIHALQRGRDRIGSKLPTPLPTTEAGFA